MKNLIKLIAILFCGSVLGSCSQKVKKTIGIANAGPNEYSVTKNKPLEVPPHFNISEIKKEAEKPDQHKVLESGKLKHAEKALLQALDKK